MKYRDDILQRLHDRIEVSLRTADAYQRQCEQEHGSSALVVGMRRSKVQAAVRDIKMMASRVGHINRMTDLTVSEYNKYKDLVMRVSIVQHLS